MKKKRRLFHVPFGEGDIEVAGQGGSSNACMNETNERQCMELTINSGGNYFWWTTAGTNKSDPLVRDMGDAVQRA